MVSGWWVGSNMVDGSVVGESVDDLSVIGGWWSVACRWLVVL